MGPKKEQNGQNTSRIKKILNTIIDKYNSLPANITLLKHPQHMKKYLKHFIKNKDTKLKIQILNISEDIIPWIDDKNIMNCQSEI